MYKPNAFFIVLSASGTIRRDMRRSITYWTYGGLKNNVQLKTNYAKSQEKNNCFLRIKKGMLYRASLVGQHLQ